MATNYYIEISFPLTLDFDIKTTTIEKYMKKEFKAKSVGSGAGFGRRDITFENKIKPTPEIIEKIKTTVCELIQYKRGVKVAYLEDYLME
jgi:hypothetical protein